METLEPSSGLIVEALNVGDDSSPGVDAVSSATLVDSIALACSRVLLRYSFVGDKSGLDMFVPTSGRFGFVSILTFGFFTTLVGRGLEGVFGCGVASAPESDACSAPLIRELRLAATPDGLPDNPASGPVLACEASILTKAQSL